MTGTDDARGTAPDDDPSAAEPAAALDRPRERTAVVRRAPRYRRFVLAGVLLGLLVAVVAWSVVELPRLATEGGSPTTLRLVVLAATTGAVGALLGAAAAVVADRRSSRGRP